MAPVNLLVTSTYPQWLDVPWFAQKEETIDLLVWTKTSWDHDTRPEKTHDLRVSKNSHQERKKGEGEDENQAQRGAM